MNFTSSSNQQVLLFFKRQPKLLNGFSHSFPNAAINIFIDSNIVNLFSLCACLQLLKIGGTTTPGIFLLHITKSYFLYLKLVEVMLLKKRVLQPGFNSKKHLQ